MSVLNRTVSSCVLAFPWAVHVYSFRFRMRDLYVSLKVLFFIRFFKCCDGLALGLTESILLGYALRSPTIIREQWDVVDDVLDCVGPVFVVLWSFIWHMNIN